VTLQLLASPSLDAAVAAADARIAGRVDELVRLGLATRSGSRLAPTARGCVVGRLVAALAGRFASAS
jgi:hypothetical protein